jgi:hypothetical protein
MHASDREDALRLHRTTIHTSCRVRGYFDCSWPMQHPATLGRKDGGNSKNLGALIGIGEAMLIIQHIMLQPRATSASKVDLASHRKFDVDAGGYVRLQFL